MINKTDLIGKKFGKLIVLELGEKDKHRHTTYKCKCECGRETLARKYSLLDGSTKTCGCWAENKNIVYQRALHQQKMKNLRNKK